MPSPLKPLRDRIVRDYLADGALKPGERLPSTRQIAVHYGVSTPTLCKAIALLAAEGWVTVRQGSGIYAASAERARRNRSQPRIGCVVPSLEPLLTHRIFEGVERVARRRGHIVEVASSNWGWREERRHIAAMRERGVKGVWSTTIILKHRRQL